MISMVIVSVAVVSVALVSVAVISFGDVLVQVLSVVLVSEAGNPPRASGILRRRGVKANTGPLWPCWVGNLERSLKP